MQKIKTNQFTYTLLEHVDDVTSMPLTRNLFGLNNKIYANLASIKMTDEHREQLKGSYSERELRYGLINRLFEVHIHTRTERDEYDIIENIDFQQLFDFVKDKKKDFYTIHGSYFDDGDKTNEELRVLHIPLGADILLNAANYAYQEIERIKMDNSIMNIGNIEHLANLINVL